MPTPPLRSCRLALGAALLGVALAAGPADAGEVRPPTRDPRDPIRVLFVGNSYVYTNDLPFTVARVAQARGVDLWPGMLAEPNYAIEDHIVSGALARALDRGWDWVVLQQGPSSLPESREHLRRWSMRAATMARERGIAVALMSAWPALGNAHTWLAAEESYREAAAASGACVLPVATAWRLAREADPTVDLYLADNLHPDRAGTLLAALTIVRGLYPWPLTPQAPDTAAVFEEFDWRPAVGQTAALDRAAARAVEGETERCFFAK